MGESSATIGHLMAVSFDVSDGIAVIRIDEPLHAALPRARDLLPEVADARALVLLLGHGLGTADSRRLLRASTAERADFSSSLHALLTGLADLRTPIVAAIAGSAVGDAVELAMACDRRVLASNGELVRVTGRQVLFGRRVSAEEALRTGLVDRVAPAADVVRAATELANECKCAQAERNSCRIVAP